MRLSIRLLVILALLAPSLFAERFPTPQPSPHARVEETVGITTIAVDYHRPSVKGRVIWGGLVPYDVIWRAGANEPTLVSFSSAVKVEEQPLAAGTYSFYLIPGEKQWTVVFNRFTGGWGTYSYDPAEDVLRVKVTAEQAPMQERLLYAIEDATDVAATLAMRWEKLRVPLRIAVDTPALVKASIESALRSELHWDATAWGEAAMYAFRSRDLDAALRYADRALDMQPSGQNYRLKARILEAKGDAAAAKPLMERAAQLMTPARAARSTAFMLMAQKKLDEATAVMTKEIAANPNSWEAHVVMGDILATKGDRAAAKESFAKAMALAPGQSERTEVQDSINAMMAEVK